MCLHSREIRQCIRATLETVVKENKLDLVDTGDIPSLFISPGPVRETWMCDQLISEQLKRKFTREVTALENDSEEAKNWHPESNNQLRHLVHPSLYYSNCEQTPNDEAVYQWLPSEIRIDSSGDVQILSYIINLQPAKHSAMYASIASIFQQFVPMFDRVLSCLLTEHGPEPSVASCDQRIPDTLPLSPCTPPFTLRGRTVQVIVTIAETILTPERPSYPGGSWHSEGSAAEQLVAAGIYYFGCENITESRLALRVMVSKQGLNEWDTLGMAGIYETDRGFHHVQNLGAVVTEEDRCIVFPNTLQHRVEPFELADKTKPGVRKILAFFIVDPFKTIP